MISYVQSYDTLNHVFRLKCDDSKPGRNVNIIYFEVNESSSRSIKARAHNVKENTNNLTYKCTYKVSLYCYEKHTKNEVISFTC